jgi:hypothetical protein
MLVFLADWVMKWRACLKNGSSDQRQLKLPSDNYFSLALTHQNCYWEVGGCLIENATGVNPRRKGKNEETDQIEHTTRTDSSHQTALSSSGSGRQKDDAG